MTKPDIDAIKRRRDWRQGRDLSQFELRLDDECWAKHYAEDVTVLIEEVERLSGLLDRACSLAEKAAQTEIPGEFDEATFDLFMLLGKHLAASEEREMTK